MTNGKKWQKRRKALKAWKRKLGVLMPGSVTEGIYEPNAGQFKLASELFKIKINRTTDEVIHNGN